MKIQCDVCERAEAALLCCADEAALCWGCDGKVHAANKLAGKHQRVPLLPWSSSSSKSSSSSSSSSQIPICDICQEVGGYFFCLEDRALLCRQCDVAVHTASPYVSSHQRFLITGVRVALQHHLNNSGTDKSTSSNSYSSNNNPLSSLASTNSTASKKLSASSTTSYVGEEMEGIKSQWSWSELLDDVELDACYGVSEPASSS